MEKLSKLSFPQFSFERFEEVSSLGELFAAVYSLVQQEELEPTIILIQEQEESPEAVKGLMLFLRSIKGKVPEEILFMGVAKSRPDAINVHRSLEKQLIFGEEDYSDRILAVVSAAGNNRQFCHNIANALTHPAFFGFAPPMPGIPSAQEAE